jgi:hypothetical protein
MCRWTCEDVIGGETRSATCPLSGLIVPRDRRSARDEVAGESQVVIKEPLSTYFPFIRPRISDIMLSRSASAFARSLINSSRLYGRPGTGWATSGFIAGLNDRSD